MNLPQFNVALGKILVRGKPDYSRVGVLGDKVRTEMVYCLVGNRMPIPCALIPAEFDMHWLKIEMLYLYTTVKNGVKYLHQIGMTIK